MDLSSHAYKRLLERTTLSPSLLSFYLENNLDVLIRNQKRIFLINNERQEECKNHKLIYNPSHNDYYVIVQDDDKGKIITVLKEEHYHTKIPFDLKEKAKLKVQNFLN